MRQTLKSFEYTIQFRPNPATIGSAIDYFQGRDPDPAKLPSLLDFLQTGGPDPDKPRNFPRLCSARGLIWTSLLKSANALRGL